MDDINMCAICDKTFTKSRNLKRHMTEVHNNLKHWRCPQCTGKFTRRSNLAAHLERMHSMSKYDAKCASVKASQHSNQPKVGKYSDISDDDTIFDLITELDEFVSSASNALSSENTSDTFFDSLDEAEPFFQQSTSQNVVPEVDTISDYIDGLDHQKSSISSDKNDNLEVISDSIDYGENSHGNSPLSFAQVYSPISDISVTNQPQSPCTAVVPYQSSAELTRTDVTFVRQVHTCTITKQYMYVGKNLVDINTDVEFDFDEYLIKP